MDVVTGKFFNQLVLSLYREGRDVPLARFQDWALEQVRTLIPFDSACWGNAAMELAAVHWLHLYGCDPSIIDAYPLVQEKDFFRTALMAAPGICLNLSDLTSRASYLATSLYRDFGARYQIEWALATLLINPATSLSEFLTIWRHDPDQPFSDAERQIKELLMPHLVEAYRVVRLRHFLRDKGLRHNAWAIIDKRGCVQELSPGFNSCMHDIWPGWHGNRLPEPLAKCVLNGNPYTSNEFKFETIRSETFRFTEVKPHNMLDKLTTREIEIVSRYAIGSSSSDISVVLSLSPTTVRNHIANCYKKLGVNNKVELAAIYTQSKGNLGRNTQY
jgi:DNA-binding CsgD family transcriptional regulator